MKMINEKECDKNNFYRLQHLPADPSRVLAVFMAAMASLFLPLRPLEGVLNCISDDVAALVQDRVP